jgi:hypothetical protein
MITATAWNRFLVRRRRERLNSLVIQQRGVWRHPWFTFAEWNAQRERWEAQIKPGFVDNGRLLDVTVSVESEDGAGRSDVPLTAFPRIPLTSYRAVGTGTVSIDGSGERVPEYFLSRGVGEPVSLSTASGEGIQQEVTGLFEDLDQQRILRACDIVLYHDRLSTATQWQITPGETGAQAQFSVLYQSRPNARPGAYLQTTARHEPIGPVADLTRLLGGWQDLPYDTVRLCTVWLLSPPGAALDAQPDATWEPHVEHNLFWDVRYLVTRPALGVVKQNLEVNLAGLGGIAGAQITVNQILSQTNDAIANTLEFLTKRQIIGRFVSPGPSSVKWDRAQSLDPPFPYRGL